MKKFKRLASILMLAAAVVFAAGCTKPDDPNNGGNDENENEVMVTTITPSDITTTSAVCGAEVSVSQGVTLSCLGVCWSTNENPTVNDSQLSTTSWNESFTCTITDLDAGTLYHVRAFAKQGQQYYYGNDKSFTTESGVVIIGGHTFIDLGLPSGLLWATCNVGAATPESFGDYFTWGDTLPQDYYGWETYKYANGNQDQLTKYCYDAYWGYNGYTDDLTELVPTDDVAASKWGNGARMPTIGEWREFRDGCWSERVTQNGVEGRVFTGPNGNTIFLPFAGMSVEDKVNFVGSTGLYWSSTLSSQYTTWGCDFSISSTCDISNGVRAYGLSVRPVYSAK